MPPRASKNYEQADHTNQTQNEIRTSANALFLRGFDREILEEMRGIADGANANGAKFLNRKLDLTDIVAANTEIEMEELRDAVSGPRFFLPVAEHEKGQTVLCPSLFARTCQRTATCRRTRREWNGRGAN